MIQSLMKNSPIILYLDLIYSHICWYFQINYNMRRINMIVKFLSSKDYLDQSKNYGDCILIDNQSSKELVIYDCGCEKHAKRVISYMKNRGYKKAKFVLSHNDADHFNGFNALIKEGVLSEVYTHLLLKYKGSILELIDDNRRNLKSTAERIKEIFDNIDYIATTTKSNKIILKNIFTDTSVATGVTIVGPEKKCALTAVAKMIDSRKSNIIDNETIVNAVSTQLSVDFGHGNSLLLTGDSNFEFINKKEITKHSAIQLPHHGKLKHAEKIFNCMDISTIYYVSDNTGNTNGGSDQLRTEYPKGRIIHYTQDGDQICDASTFQEAQPTQFYF